MKATLFVIAATCAMILMGSFQNLSPAELPADLCQITQSFDREACEADCRATYGAEWYELQRRGGRGIGGRGSIGNYYLYARCIQECNDRFWKEFDREHQ